MSEREGLRRIRNNCEAFNKRPFGRPESAAKNHHLSCLLRIHSYGIRRLDMSYTYKMNQGNRIGKERAHLVEGVTFVGLVGFVVAGGPIVGESTLAGLDDAVALDTGDLDHRR